MKFTLLYVSVYFVVLVAKSQPTFDFIKNKIDYIDGVVKINNDSIFCSTIDTSKLISLYNNSFNLNDKMYGFVYLLNKNNTQYLRCNSKEIDGYWNDYFTVGYCNKKFLKNHLHTAIKVFTSHYLIRLGINEQEIIRIAKKNPDCVLIKGVRKIIKFYWFNREGLDYEVYGIPSYVASFILIKNKLIKFGFGEYKAELDKDFFPKTYRVIKGRLYQ